MATLTVTPNPAPPATTVDVSGDGFNPKLKFALTTVDAAGVEVGRTSNTNRPRRDGTFRVGINVPPVEGQSKIRAYQGSTLVAEASVLVQKPVVTPPPPTTNSVRVSSIPDLLAKLADNSLDEIVVANGTYRVNAASSQQASSLWIGSKFASRTKAITVRAETAGGVTLDGGGTNYFGGLTFVDGAHHQTWDGFKFANGGATKTGVIVFGAYNLPAAHHITLRNITMLPSIFGTTDNNDHFIYFSKDGAHDILIEDYTATANVVPAGQPGIKSALQWYHGQSDGSGSINAYNVTVRRMHVNGTMSAILCYESSVHDVLIEDFDITNVRDASVNFATCGANFVIRNGRGNKGVYYPNGKPAGLTIENCVWG